MMTEPRRAAGKGLFDNIAASLKVIADASRAQQQSIPKRRPWKVQHFRLLCCALLGARAEKRADIRRARALTEDVEGGHIGWRTLPEVAREKMGHLSEVDRAFAVGLAMGFMTEFLPHLD